MEEFLRHYYELFEAVMHFFSVIFLHSLTVGEIKRDVKKLAALIFDFNELMWQYIWHHFSI